jgi:hypothetical protein
MQQNKKKTILMILITVLMVGLGAVAVITALRLRQLADQPVAPTAPQSQPRAAIPEAEFCTTAFTVAQSTCDGWCDDDSDCSTGYVCYVADGETAGVCRAETTDCDLADQDNACACPAADVVTCRTKLAYRDHANNTPGNYVYGNSGINLDELRIDNNEVVSPGEKFVYAITVGIATQSGTVVITDNLPSEVDYVDSIEECTMTNHRVVCDFDEVEFPQVAYIRVQAKSNIVANTSIRNRAEVVDGHANDSVCENVVQVAVGPTPTPTPTPTPAPDATPTPTLAPDVTPVPTIVAPELPQAGSIVPTFSIIMIGGVLLLAGLVGLLFW